LGKTKVKGVKVLRFNLVLFSFLFLSLVLLDRSFSKDIYANDGTYLGNTNNEYDSNSINNPYGKYGSEYSSNSINNPYGKYGSEYSSTSPNNKYSRPGRAVDWNSNTYQKFGGSGY
jgi:hypothetical protein